MAPFRGSLQVKLGDEVVQVVRLGDEVVTIGRLPSNTIALAHQAVSRNHAEARLDPAVGVVLTDKGSAGGTFVGGTRLLPSQPVVLGPGQGATIGPFTLTFLVDEEAAAPAPPPPPPAPRPAAPAPTPTRAAEPAPTGTRAAKKKADTTGAAAAAPPAPPGPPGPPPDDQLPDLRPRPTFPAWRPPHDRSRYLRFLPSIFHEADFLGRMLLIQETIWEPLERRQDHIHMYFHPRTAPARMLPFLGAWLDLAVNPLAPEDRRRRLLTEAMDLYRWRGTAYGLTRMIEVVTGITPTITEDPAQPYVFRIRVDLPAGSDVRKEAIEDLVRANKPAHVGYVLEVRP